jgi:ribosomal protein S27AE
MVMDGKLTLIWDIYSLKMALETVYNFMVNDADQPLRICKHCGTVFFATHGRLEFCGDGAGRNQFNVCKSRGKG